MRFLRFLTLFLVAAAPARAHLVSTELGPFYDGAAHPLVTPEDLLLILGFAVLAAFSGVATGRRTLTSLAFNWTLGVLTGFAIAAVEITIPYASAVMLILVGLAGALRRQLPTGFLGWLAAFVGFSRGFLNGSAAREADGVWLSAIGIATGVFLAVSLAMGLAAVVERRGWTTVLRVAASWIAAIGLLMLGWEIQTFLT